MIETYVIVMIIIEEGKSLFRIHVKSLSNFVFPKKQTTWIRIKKTIAVFVINQSMKLIFLIFSIPFISRYNKHINN